ncbi:hypothetical protein [Mesorhizobium sp. B1-1-7]|uniref:hypothetical protein n=1 Tax=Mesorhizobium sp. B1-1-7 TaxID=2589977 RepID=UPI0015E2B6E8|nr:hypothetical protein [Mesorhizobium sp. B1-1-7]
MKALLDRYLPLRAPDDGGGGGDPPPAPVAPAPGAPPPAAPSPAPPAPGAEPPAAGPYRPQGLADTMYGKDDRETIDKLHKAVEGYRQRDSAVPDKPEAYQTFEIDKAPEAIRPHLQQLAKDPLFAAVSKVAMEEKIPVATMHKLTTALYAQAAEAGILEAPVDIAAERTALLPDSAKSMAKADQDKAIDARMQANEDFVNLMTQQGLPKDVAEHGLLMLMDTAKGNQLLEFFAGKMTGAGAAQPFGGAGAAGGDKSAREALRAEMAAPEMDPQHPKFNRAKYDELDQKYKKLFGG